MLKAMHLPAPIDGLNVRSSPYDLQITEAQQLDNYLVYDWGIRETGGFSAQTQPTSGTIGQIIFFKDGNYAALALICVANKVYLANTPSTWSGATNLTGALTITSDAWRYCIWSHRIFMVNATNVGLIYDIAAGTLAADTFTGLTTDNASQVFSFKQRLYFIEKNSTSFWYTAESAVAGALTEYDVTDFLEDYGNLLFGASWSVNQGNYNEQLFILVTTAGEVLVYSGDNPEADNWGLVTRVAIPKPIGNQAFTRLGQDLLICTARGVVSLSAILAGKQDNESYYLVSGKVADQFGMSANVPPAKDTVRPFLHFPSSSGQYVFALNYERGAWSRLDTTAGSDPISALSFWEDTSGNGNFVFIAFPNGTTKKLDDASGNSAGHAWRTGFLPIEPEKYKQVHKVRAIGRNTAGTSQFVNKAACRFDVLTDTATDDTKTTTTSSTAYVDHELQTPGVGRRPSLIFSKTSSGEQNEITGVDIFWSANGGQE